MAYQSPIVKFAHEHYADPENDDEMALMLLCASALAEWATIQGVPVTEAAKDLVVYLNEFQDVTETVKELY